jgi:hypothetical protein
MKSSQKFCLFALTLFLLALIPAHATTYSVFITLDEGWVEHDFTHNITITHRTYFTCENCSIWFIQRTNGSAYCQNYSIDGNQFWLPADKYDAAVSDNTWFDANCTPHMQDPTVFRKLIEGAQVSSDIVVPLFIDYTDRASLRNASLYHLIGQGIFLLGLAFIVGFALWYYFKIGIHSDAPGFSFVVILLVVMLLMWVYWKIIAWVGSIFTFSA